MARTTPPPRRAGLVDAWRPLGRGLGREEERAFEAVLARARRHETAGVDGALLAVLAEYEAELQRLLARVSWLEAESTPPEPRRAPHPSERRFREALAPHAPEDDVEEDPERPEDGVGA